MYQAFKKRLLDEMEMRRDMFILRASEPAMESIFEVSASDDKLYKKFLMNLIDWQFNTLRI